MPFMSLASKSQMLCLLNTTYPGPWLPHSADNGPPLPWRHSIVTASRRPMTPDTASHWAEVGRGHKNQCLSGSLVWIRGPVSSQGLWFLTGALKDFVPTVVCASILCLKNIIKYYNIIWRIDQSFIFFYVTSKYNLRGKKKSLPECFLTPTYLLILDHCVYFWRPCFFVGGGRKNSRSLFFSFLQNYMCLFSNHWNQFLDQPLENPGFAEWAHLLWLLFSCSSETPCDWVL